MAVQMERTNTMVGIAELIGDKRAVFFDFDGVVLDSNRLKIEAMKATLAPFGQDRVDRFIDSFRTRFGDARVHHFRRFFHDHLGQADGFDSFYAEHEPRYAARVLDGYAKAPLTKSIVLLLRHLRERSIACHIVTGGEPGQASQAVDQRGLGIYFDSIRGAPTTKTEHFRAIMASADLTADDVVFFGDASADIEAARAVGIDFVFVETWSLIPVSALPSGDRPFWAVPDLSPLCAARRIGGERPA